MLQAAVNWKNLPPWGVIGNAFAWFSWMIWTSRNLLIFEQKALTPQETAIKAIKEHKRLDRS